MSLLGAQPAESMDGKDTACGREWRAIKVRKAHGGFRARREGSSPRGGGSFEAYAHAQTFLRTVGPAQYSTADPNARVSGRGAAKWGARLGLGRGDLPASSSVVLVEWCYAPLRSENIDYIRVNPNVVYIPLNVPGRSMVTHFGEYREDPPLLRDLPCTKPIIL